MALRIFRAFARPVAISLIMFLGVQVQESKTSDTVNASLLPTLVSGQVLDATGLPDSDAEIMAFALPDTTGVADGTPVPLTLAATGLGGNLGDYLLGVLPSTLVDSLLNGVLNLQLIATSGGQQMDTFLSLDVPSLIQGLLGDWTLTGTPDSSAAPSVKFDFSDGSIEVSPVPDSDGETLTNASYVDDPSSDEATDPGTDSTTTGKPDAPTTYLASPTSTTYHDTPVPVTHGLTKVADAAFPDASDATSSSDIALQSVPYCYTVPGPLTKNVKEHFATTNTMSSIPETVTEGTSSSHTLGVAESDDFGDHWHANGTASISRSSSHTAAVTYNTSHTVYNRTNYRQYGGSCTHTTYKRAESFYDILTDDGSNVSETWYYNCGHHAKNTTWATGSAKAQTISGGVTLGPLALSAQSGFSSSVDLKYTFNAAGEVCGNSSSGPLSSSQVEADTF